MVRYAPGRRIADQSAVAWMSQRGSRDCAPRWRYPGQFALMAGVSLRARFGVKDKPAAASWHGDPGSAIPCRAGEVSEAERAPVPQASYLTRAPRISTAA